MAIPVQTQWTLVASGLVAHADHVLAGEECDRLMTMVEQEVDGDEYAEWMAAIGDPERLEALFEQLDQAPSDCHREILEEAWLIAVVDGERADEELEALRRVADRLGVAPKQLDGWREAWNSAQHGYAEVATAALAWVLGDGEPVAAADHGVVDQFVHALFTTHEHREALATAGRAAASGDDVERRARQMGKPPRRDLLRRIAEVVGEANAPDGARDRYHRLATALDLPVGDDD